VSVSALKALEMACRVLAVVFLLLLLFGNSRCEFRYTSTSKPPVGAGEGE